MSTLAIDIGGTKLAAARVDDDLRIRERRELPTPASKTPDALREALKVLVEPLQTTAQRVAIASTGIIREGALLAINPHNLGGLLHFPLVQTLEDLTGLPTLAVNDAQAAAWAEYHALTSDVRDMVFITVSTGVGGGVVSDGRLLTGMSGLAGHLGHTLADPQGPVCGCGRRGLCGGYRLRTRHCGSGAGFPGRVRRQNCLCTCGCRERTGCASGSALRAGCRAVNCRC
ncbi:N-acetylmannosamine kinase [Citrobacter koseri]|uniref:N-acetylmannosamine kinase n=1 Tax=Citrobacter koseri TaxID=545 RepID=A0A447ULE5_CITKO|nr:N-acetylmannosamine kinase [Citrobacter koseri]